jgi:predicted nucleic acid-binding protein
MTFADLLAGDVIFLDANTFIYHFTNDPLLGPPCNQLLSLVENGTLRAYTAAHLMGEVAHKLMTVEAATRFGWPIPGMANRLRRHPAEVQQLTEFRQAVERVAQSRVQVLDVSLSLLVTATALCQQTGLLINDALIVAVMQANGLTKLASHDGDFDRVPGLTRYAPV